MTCGWLGTALTTMAVATALPAVAQQTTIPPQAAGSPASPPADQQLGENGDIVVAAPTRKVIGNQVRAATGPTSNNVPLARFQVPVCVAVGGLSGRIAGGIAQRMLEDADDHGLTLAGDGCRPNTMVLFVDDAHAEIARMARNNHRALSGVGFNTRRALLKNKGPAFAWRLTEIRTRDGETSGPEDGRPVFRIATASHINHPVRQDVVTAVLIVERRATLGKTSRQLADYAALRLFAGARPVTGGQLGTILSLFGDGKAPPAELTAFDRGYLRGLYAAPANGLATSQRGAMTRAIVKANAAP